MRRYSSNVLRETACVLACICVVIVASFSVSSSSRDASISLRSFFIENGYADTGAKNIVAAIYLDYRLLDSLLEAGLLLVTIAGVVHVTGSRD